MSSGTSSLSVDPKRVVLEINEDAAAGDYEEVSEAVGALRATGVRIALDDTGSGSVSFSGLFDVHADIIKIDIDVTHGITSDPMKEAMASALKVLADRLGAMSLAEGIETEEELNFLQGVGVQAGQGYLFGRPEADSATEDCRPDRQAGGPASVVDIAYCPGRFFQVTICK